MGSVTGSLRQRAALIFIMALVAIGPFVVASAASPAAVVEAGESLSSSGDRVTATTGIDPRIRSGPGTTYPQVGVVPLWTTLVVQGRSTTGQWIFVDYDGMQGWIAAWVCEISGDLESVPVMSDSSDTSSSGSQVTATADGYLHIRAEPSADASQVGQVPYRTTLAVLGRDSASEWIFVDYEGTQGWIAAWLCEIEGDLDSVPVTDGSQSAALSPTPVTPSPTPLPSSPPPSSSDGQVTATTEDELNIRVGPGPDYTQVGVVPPRTTVAVAGRDGAGRWILIDYNGVQGWIAGWYCDIAGTLSSVPVASVTITPPPPASPVPPPAPSDTVEGIVPYNLVMTDAVVSNIRSIYRRGQAYGNNPRAFSRAGDCETMSEVFLRPIGWGEYDLGEFGYLQGVIDYYFDSYAYIGYASHEGFDASSILDPTWADPSICQTGESPLACEYRLHRPAIALILLRTQVADAGPYSQYYNDMRRVVDLTIQRGIIPVISTGPYQAPPLPPVEPMNDSIRQIAAEYNIPLWDFWLTTESLLNHGIDESNHLTWMHESAHFYLPSIDKAMTRRNLEALQILYTLSTLVNQ
jgi:uncharacterized protein YraI